jgi:hypothetical protein
MRMNKRSLFRALAVGLVACSFGAANAMAGTVLVTSDGGNFDFSMTATTTGGVTTVDFTYSDVTLTSVNGPGSPAGFPVASTFDPASLTLTGSVPTPPSIAGFTTYTFTEPAGGLAIFGDGTGTNAETLNHVTSGFSFGGTMSVNGTVAVVPTHTIMETSGTSPTSYNFSPLGDPGSAILLTYNNVGATFGETIANGGTITGTGSFTEQAGVPEPSSMALLGIGLSSLIALRAYAMRRARR